MSSKLADGTHGFRITEAVRLEFTIGDKEVSDWFLVYPVQKEHPVFLGLPWFERYLADAIESFKSFGRPASPLPSAAYAAVLQAGGGEKEALLAAVEARTEQIFDATVAQLRHVELVAPHSAPDSSLPEDFQDFADVFDSDFEKHPIQPLHGIEFEINCDSLPPPATKNVPRSPKQLEEERRQLDTLLKLKRCRPSSAPTAAPSFFVNKQCESCHQLRCSCGKHAYPQRWVIDYRQLNRRTPQIAYPLPDSSDLINQVAGHKYYIKFDIDTAFQAIPIAEKDRHKTAFLTSFGLYEMCVMTFGFKNAPAYFQRLMDSILSPVRHFCRAFFDDGVVWADSREELVTRFKQVLTIMRSNGLRLKLKKCEFFKSSVHFLGHIVSTSGVASDPAKVKAIRDWPEPRSKSDIRGFTGLASYYRTYYPKYSEDAAPLHECCKNDQPNTFDKLPPRALAAFNKIKAFWSNDAHLGKFRADADTDLFTDASSEAWAGAIEQNHQPIAFGSGKFTDTQRKWSTTDRELFACLMMHRKFGHYLRNENTTWWTDHEALKSLKSTLADSPRRERWRAELDQYPFTIRHIPGKDAHVDGMTRHSTWPKDAGYGGTDSLVEPDRFDNPSPLQADASQYIRDNCADTRIQKFLMTCVNAYCADSPLAHK